jgi:hypothetical protein
VIATEQPSRQIQGFLYPYSLDAQYSAQWLSAPNGQPQRTVIIAYYTKSLRQVLQIRHLFGRETYRDEQIDEFEIQRTDAASPRLERCESGAASPWRGGDDS